MRTIRRFAVPVLLLALAVLALPAEATIWCEDFCCNSPCWRDCWTYDPVLTTCEKYGFCSGSPECTGFAANSKADAGEVASPLVCSGTADPAPAPAPVPIQPTTPE